MITGQAPPIREGDLIAGKYRVEQVLGQGGMGVVVRAVHIELGERRAIKWMLPEMQIHADAVERFMREARAAARLKSEHVAKVYDVGRLERGEPYMVMEFLEGEDLACLIKRMRTVPPALMAVYILQALEAIAEAHAAGIVHRDLKPANLFVATDLEGYVSVKVLDFGISKLTELQADTPVGLTSPTMAMGSPLYMSPEQMRSARDVDARSDIWSLGVIMYELLTGREPFFDTSLAVVCTRVMSLDPAPLRSYDPAIPVALEAVVLRCLAKDPAARYQNAAELAQALAGFAGPEVERSLRRVRHVLARAGKLPNATPSDLNASINTSSSTASSGLFPRPQSEVSTSFMSPAPAPTMLSAAAPARPPARPTGSGVRGRSVVWAALGLSLLTGSAVGLLFMRLEARRPSTTADDPQPAAGTVGSAPATASGTKPAVAPSPSETATAAPSSSSVVSSAEASSVPAASVGPAAKTTRNGVSTSYLPPLVPSWGPPPIAGAGKRPTDAFGTGRK